MDSPVQDDFGAVLADPTLIAPELSPILAGMLQDSRPGYRQPAAAIMRALQSGLLAGIQTSSRRFWITLRLFRARPLAPASGAHVQVLPRRNPPGDDEDLVGWIVTQDHYRSGPLMMVHEMSHFLNRLVVWRSAEQPAMLVDPALARGLEPPNVRWVRARLLDEIAARHMAWLGEEGVTPGSTTMPEPGAFFACAVKIASYPEVYADTGLMPRLLGRGDRNALRDQIGLWFPALRGFRWFDPGTPLAHHHAQWLDRECDVAAAGRHAPEVAAVGTL